MEQRIKKKTTLIIAALLSLALVWGCSSQNNSTSQPSESSAATTTPQSSTAAETPETPETLEPVTLQWFYPGTPQPDQDEVFAKVNEIVKAKINATVQFNPIDFGSYADKMKVKTAAGEAFDLVFTAGWIHTYEQNAAAGAFLALDDMLDKYAPKTYASMPDYMWELGAKVNGKIYGVPNYQAVALPGGMWFKKELVDKYNIDLSKLYPGMPNDELYQVLDGYYKIIKENEPNIWPIEVFQEGFWGNVLGESFNNLNSYADGIYNKDLTKIVNSYETPEFAKYMGVARDWFKKEYIRQDVISNKRASNNPDEKAGRYFSGFTGASPNAAANLKTAWGYDVVVVPTSKTYLNPGNFAATMTAVSATSKNPERALMLVELMNTDKELYNLIGLGIEGKHYKMVKEGVIELIPDSKYNPANHWMFGSEFNLYVTNGLPEDIWEQQKKLNETAELNVLKTFKVKNEAIVDRVKQIQAIIVEYSSAIASGAIDGQEKLKEMNDKLYQAGLAEVQAEDLKQLQAWQASQ